MTLAGLASIVRGASLVQTPEVLCGETFLNAFLNGEFIYRDTHHIRRNLEAAIILQHVAFLALE